MAKSRRQYSHPRAVAIENPHDAVADTPFAEGEDDALDADLRHRVISERAYARYRGRGYADGYDLDDWLEAEAEVDHTLIPSSQAA
jgi:hypothetical protein